MAPWTPSLDKWGGQGSRGELWHLHCLGFNLSAAICHSHDPERVTKSLCALVVSSPRVWWEVLQQMSSAQGSTWNFVGSLSEFTAYRNSNVFTVSLLFLTYTIWWCHSSAETLPGVHSQGLGSRCLSASLGATLPLLPSFLLFLSPQTLLMLTLGLAPSNPSSFCLNITSSRRPSLGFRMNQVPLRHT